MSSFGKVFVDVLGHRSEHNLKSKHSTISLVFVEHSCKPVLFLFSSDDDNDSDSLDFRLGHLQQNEDDPTDWFSVVGDSEHASTSRYAIFISIIFTSVDELN